MNQHNESIEEAIRLLQEGKHQAVVDLLLPAASNERPGGNDAAPDKQFGLLMMILGLGYYFLEQYETAGSWFCRSASHLPGNADLLDLTQKAAQNVSGKIDVFVPAFYLFEGIKNELLQRPTLDEFALPNPPMPRFALPWEQARRDIGETLGAVVSFVVTHTTGLWGCLAGYQRGIWTNWYNRSLFLGVLTLAYMRDRLNKQNLKSTYPRGAKVGFPVEGLKPPTSAAYFRTADGSWNDLDDPLAGAAGTRFMRNVRLDAIRPETVNDTLLQPNPREISRKLLTRKGDMPQVPFLNMLAAAWIQFENHDWINHGEAMSRFEMPYSLPLEEDDPARRKYFQKTMFVGRTQPDPTRNAGGKEDASVSFLNEVTHWWDGSQIYGSSQATQNRLRSFSDGKLTVTAEGTLPLDEDKLEITGFNRNWWIGLTLLHTLFVREHNQICDHLKTAYPDWDDNRLFNVARLVNAAIMAKIHTVEWTPAILPNPGLNEALNANWFGILTNFFEYGKDRETLSEIKIRNPEMGGVVGNPRDNHGVPYGLTEEFVEVYRLHSLLPEALQLRRIGSSAVKEVLFPESRQAGSAQLTGEYGLANLLYSFGKQQPGQLVLNNFPRFMQELSIPGNPLFDLGAVDILRARERGVPRYNEFRRQLGLNPITRFEDLENTPEQTALLKKVYGDDVEKLDLLIGTLAEGSKVRPTSFGFGETMFQIFILNATRRLQADRFYTESYNEETYTREGLDWIDAADLKTVLLRNFPELGRTGLANVRNAFEPWDEAPLLDPERHPLRKYAPDLKSNPWPGERYRHLLAMGWSESVKPDSKEEAAEIARFKSYGSRIQAVQRRIQENLRTDTPKRAQHVKCTASTARAHFTIAPEVPQEIQSVLFRPNASYPVTLRFSNAHASAQADTERDLRGLAIRIAGDNGIHYDFLGTNAPYHHASDVEEIVELSEATADPSVVAQLLAALKTYEASGLAGKVLHNVENFADLSATARRLLVATRDPAAVFRMLATLLKQTSIPVESLASETYYSRAPIALNPHSWSMAAKYQFTPVVSKSALPLSTPDLHAELRARLLKDPVSFYFQVQLYVDEERTPIEKPTQEWLSTDSHPLTLGTLTLERQDLDDPANAVDADALRFNPWNVDPAVIRPLGELNRSRRFIYPASAETRKP